MPDFGSFAGGFASSYSQASSAAQEQRRLSDVLQFQREQFDYSKTQDERNYEQEQEKFQFTKDQEASLEEHRDYADELAKNQQQIQLREFDLKVTESLLKLTDPTVPKVARQFIAKQMAQSLGVDPKSEQFKDMQGLITGLDPDALSAVSEAFMAAIPSMQPGQATAMAKAVVSGQVPMTDMLSFMKGGAKQLKPVLEPGTGRTVYADEAAAEGMEVPPSSPTVSIENKSETQLSKGLADVDVEEIKRIQEQAASGGRMLPFIRTFRAASDSGRFPTGSGAGIMKSLSGWANYLGMDAEAMGLGGKAEADIMETAGNQIVVGMAEQLGRSTNLSIDILRQSGPGLFKTPKGNRLAMDLLETIANRDIAIDKLRKRDYRTTLYPDGKPSFWEARDRLIEDFAEEDADLQKRMDSAAEEGAGIDWSKIPGVEGAKSMLEGETPNEENDWEGATSDDGKWIRKGGEWVPWQQ